MPAFHPEPPPKPIHDEYHELELHGHVHHEAYQENPEDAWIAVALTLGAICIIAVVANTIRASIKFLIRYFRKK